MSDCYRLEWIHSMQTIQTGIGESLQRDTFQDTLVICRDGMTRHNKLTLGLLLPELAAVPSSAYRSTTPCCCRITGWQSYRIASLKCSLQ